MWAWVPWIMSNGQVSPLRRAKLAPKSPLGTPLWHPRSHTTPEGEKTILSGDIIRRVDVSGPFLHWRQSDPRRYPPLVFHLLSAPRPVSHAIPSQQYVEGAIIGYQSIPGRSIHQHYPSGWLYFATDPSPPTDPSPIWTPTPTAPPPLTPPPVGPLPPRTPPHGPPPRTPPPF